MAKRKRRSKRKRAGARKARPRGQQTGLAEGVIAAVRAARRTAEKALGALRDEIKEAQAHLEKLVGEERDFVAELGGRAAPGRRPRRGAARAASARRPRRKGPPKADAFFAKLPARFTVEDVRKLAGKLTGPSLAQWSRAKKVRKRGKGYEKASKAP